MLDHRSFVRVLDALLKVFFTPLYVWWVYLVGFGVLFFFLIIIIPIIRFGLQLCSL